MKKLKLFGMFALTFALLFGVVACSNGSKNDDLSEVINEADLSGKWVITDVEYSYECSDEQMAALYSDAVADNGVDPDKMTLDEKIAMLGLTDVKELNFATKEEAKAYFDAQIKEADEANKAAAKQIEEMKKGYDGTGIDFDLSNETSVEINGSQDETYWINDMSMSVSAQGQSVSMSLYVCVTWEHQ